MRLTEITGFVVYDIWKGRIFQRGRLHRLDTTRMREAFTKYGIENVIALNGKINNNLQLLHDEEFIDYYHHPIPDNKLSEEDAEWLLETAGYIATMVKTGAGVLSHCNAGRNRSGLMNALIIRELENITGKEARKIVQKERPNALANEYFVKFLDGLDKPDENILVDSALEEGKDLRIAIVMAGAGSAGKSTTTKAYAIGEPDERKFSCDWIDRTGNPRNNDVKYTLYENCALTGNHHSGTDCNNAPSLVKAAFDVCVKERDVVIVDGFCSSPQWVYMINDNEDYNFHVIVIYFNLTAEEILTRLAKRRGVDKESIRERMYGRSVGRPDVLLRRFDESCKWPYDVIEVFYETSTEEIVELLDETVDDIWEEYGYELEEA